MKRLIINCLVIGLSLAVSGTSHAVPTIFGVDSASQQVVAFDPWTGTEIRRMDLPGGITATDTKIGLAGSQNFELYYINGDVDKSQVYVLDSLTGSVKSAFQIDVDPIEGGVNGLGYESSAADGYLFTTGCTYGDLHRYDAVDGGAGTIFWGGAGARFVDEAVGSDDYGRVFAFADSYMIGIEAPGIVEVDPLNPSWYRAMSTSLTDVVGMAYDGTYLYASTLDNMVYVLDPDTAAVLNQTTMDYTIYGLGAANVVPSPGAIFLGSIGVGLVGWLRRRGTL